MKDFSFKYLLASSLSDFVYLGLNSYAIVDLSNEFPLHSNFWTQVYHIWIVDYFTSCLAILNSIITLSTHRLLILKNRPNAKNMNHGLIISFLFIVALGYYSPVLFFERIEPIAGNQTSASEFNTVKTPLGSSLYGKVTPIVLSVIRLIFGLIVLTTINAFNAVEFRKRFSKKISDLNKGDNKNTYSLFFIYIFN